MPERFLILGASSFYGRNFAKLVEERGDEVECLFRPEWELGEGIGEQQVDYIVNFACASAVAESWNEPEAWLKTNAVDTISLFEDAQYLPAPKNRGPV